MDQVKLNIASGVLKPGDELPSIRSLSVPLGVNPMTISKAYNLLVHDEILVRRPGKPLVVADLGQGDIADRRLEQLRDSLRPSAALVRQLGITSAEASTVFRELLAETEHDIGETK
jgi:GntR family transcriptional regulator